MYTIDDEQRELPEEEYYGNSTWDNYKGIIFKVIIIILCIIVLIWLFKALNSNRNSNNIAEAHIANTEKLRLAAEEFFFIKNNKEKVHTVTLAYLQSEGLIDNLVDANGNNCDAHNTNVLLETDVDAYVMNLDFSCSTKDQDEKFYYHRNSLACLNCKNSKTNMTSNRYIAKEDKVNNNNNKNTNTNTSNTNTSIYSCNKWSDWTKKRVSDKNLTERKKVVVQGVNYGNTKGYTNWSEYTTLPIAKTKDIDVETKVEKERTWSDIKTGTNIDTTNPNIRIISTNFGDAVITDCANGYVYNNACYSDTIYTGNLAYSEYHSGNYKIQKTACEGTSTLRNSNGIYELTYINCRYNIKLGDMQNENNIVYTYQEAIDKDVTYYRYRLVKEATGEVKYTSKKYEEKDLPSGYVKVNGTEETYYSYKLNTCEK